MSERGNEFAQWPSRFLEPEDEEPLSIAIPPKINRKALRREIRKRRKRKAVRREGRKTVRNSGPDVR